MSLRLEIKHLTLESSAFEYDGVIPARYTCDGEGMSPPLNISNVPEKTQSLVLIMEDVDSKAGVWGHWLLWNISPTVSEIKEGETPDSVVGIGTGGVVGYQGPCPEKGEHRYYFRLYALAEKIDLPPGATREQLMAVIHEREEKEKTEFLEGMLILGKAELVGRYGSDKK